MAKGKYKRKKERKTTQAVSIASLGFSTRLENILVKAGLHTLDDMASLTDVQLKSLPGLGLVFYTAVCEKLEEHGIVLSKDNSHQH